MKAPDKGEVGGSSPPRPTIIFSRLPGVAPKASTHNPTHNLLHHRTPHAQRRKIFSLAPPVFRRSLPACTDRAWPESCPDARFPEQFSARHSPCSPACSPASCQVSGEDCGVRTDARPRASIRQFPCGKLALPSSPDRAPESRDRTRPKADQPPQSPPAQLDRR